MRNLTIRLALIACALVASATPALAQNTRRVELGGSLAAVLVHMPKGGGDNTTMGGLPSAGFGLVDPGVYLSIFATSRLAFEPQIGVFAMSEGGQSDHWGSFFGHIDYFVGDVERSSPYLFAGAGFIELNANDSVKAVDGGVGYRFRVGDRLTFRATGRFTHYYKDSGNMASLTLSIGGLLGK